MLMLLLSISKYPWQKEIAIALALTAQDVMKMLFHKINSQRFALCVGTRPKVTTLVVSAVKVVKHSSEGPCKTTLSSPFSVLTAKVV